MEEKERYRYIVATNKLYDSQEDELYFYNINSNKVISILNQQDREIKQLKKELSKYKSYKTTEERIRDLENLYSDYKKENQQLNEHIKELELLLRADKKMESCTLKAFEKLKQENQQLKQSQKQLAISELKKVKKSVLEIDKTEIKVLKNGYSTLYCDRPEVITIINNQIKELGGGKNEIEHT